ncbi:unnamed protein product [Leuciscus chuanchicus]
MSLVCHDVWSQSARQRTHPEERQTAPLRQRSELTMAAECVVIRVMWVFFGARRQPWQVGEKNRQIRASGEESNCVRLCLRVYMCAFDPPSPGLSHDESTKRRGLHLQNRQQPGSPGTLVQLREKDMSSLKNRDSM